MEYAEKPGEGEEETGRGELSVEQIFESQGVPSWREQLTKRASGVSFVPSILFCFIVMKLSLTTGIIPSLNVSAGLLGFFFVRTWTKILEKSGLLKQTFTRQENTVIQTCLVASSGVAFSGGFGSYLFAMSERAAHKSTEVDGTNIKNPSLGWIFGFLFVVSFLGLFSVVPLRRFCFDFSSTYVEVGMICPYIINISVLLGGIFSWGLMWPLIETRKGHWYHADLNPKSFQGLQGYKMSFFGKVFIAIALILGDGLYNFTKVLSQNLISLFSQFRSKGNRTIDLPVADSPSLKMEKLSYDDQRRTQLFLKDRVQMKSKSFAIDWNKENYTKSVVEGHGLLASYVTIAAISTGVLPHISSAQMVLCNSHLHFGTNRSFLQCIRVWANRLVLASTYGKLAIFTIGARAGDSRGGVLPGLAACGVMMNNVSTASDLMLDFKTGYLTLASPRSMFVSQVIGTAMGCVISPCIFWLFYKAFHDLGLPDSSHPVPFAVVYRGMTIVGVDGVSSLPNNCLLLCYCFFGAAIIINMIKDGLGKKGGRFVPLPMAMAIPFYLGPYFAIDMCVGSLILFIWEKINKAKADTFAPAVASGLICGDGFGPCLVQFWLWQRLKLPFV